MKEILFSVIVPVYNVQDYLTACFNSVISQKYESCEIILVDDGSKDSSGILCDQLAEGKDFVRVIHQKNGGLSAARNTGIWNSKGKYLVFLDSDDLLYRDSLINLENAISQSKFPDFMVSRRATLYANQFIPCKYTFTKDIVDVKELDKIYEMLQQYPDCWLGTWIFTVNRSYCLDNDLFFYDGILHEDEEWVPRLIFNAKSIGFNNDILYCNRLEREGSITATPNIKREFDKLKILDLLHTEFSNKKYNDNVRLAVKKRMEKIFFGILGETCLYQNDPRYQELLKSIYKHKSYLHHAHRNIYNLVNWSMECFGTKVTCYLLHLMIQFKKGNK